MYLETMVQCLECAVARCEAACSDLVETDLCLLPGILGVDICGECDAAEPGNSALNDHANAKLWEFFQHANEQAKKNADGNKTSGGDR